MDSMGFFIKIKITKCNPIAITCKSSVYPLYVLCMFHMCIHMNSIRCLKYLNGLVISVDKALKVPLLDGYHYFKDPLESMYCC